MIRQHRFLIVTLALALAGSVALLTSVPPVDGGEWAAAIVTLLMLTGTVGMVSWMADDTWPARPRTPRPLPEKKPKPSGLLSPEEFAKVCAEYRHPEGRPGARPS